MVNEINRLGKIQSSTLVIQQVAGGVHIDLPPLDNRILVRLTARDGALYTWTEVRPTGTGGWFTPEGARYGGTFQPTFTPPTPPPAKIIISPAYELNASEIDTFPFYTWLEPGGSISLTTNSLDYDSDKSYDCWIFNAGGAGISPYDDLVEVDLLEDVCIDNSEVIDGGTF